MCRRRRVGSNIGGKKLLQRGEITVLGGGDESREKAPSLDARAEHGRFIMKIALKDNEFRVAEISPGSSSLVGSVAVFNVAGRFCATQAKCTHRQGPLSGSALEGSTVTCPWHGSQFNVCTGAVLRGPARDPLKTYQVTVEGEIGRFEAGAPAVANTALPTA